MEVEVQPSPKTRPLGTLAPLVWSFKCTHKVCMPDAPSPSGATAGTSPWGERAVREEWVRLRQLGLSVPAAIGSEFAAETDWMRWECLCIGAMGQCKGDLGGQRVGTSQQLAMHQHVGVPGRRDRGWVNLKLVLKLKEKYYIIYPRSIFFVTLVPSPLPLLSTPAHPRPTPTLTFESEK